MKSILRVLVCPSNLLNFSLMSTVLSNKLFSVEITASAKTFFLLNIFATLYSGRIRVLYINTYIVTDLFCLGH